MAIVYGRKGNDERFDPTYEKRLKERQAEKKSTDDASSAQNEEQSFNMSAPVSRKEATRRRKATSPETPRQRRALALLRVVKGPSSKCVLTANLLLSKLDNQLGILIPRT